MSPALCPTESAMERLVADLAADRAELRAARRAGRTEALLERLATMGRRVLEAVRADGRDALTGTAAFLMLHGVVVHNARRVDLAGPLGDRWRPEIHPPARAAQYLDDAVTRTFAVCQFHRQALILPDAFAQADAAWLARAADAFNRALAELPAELWRAV